ncbi:MAG TPA: hypothetical protein PKA63_08035 [Oligoflexia bacterium]|nr:hypothetical protein [Oligoflexia bacterium]HMP48599.1 hypothetical protein [Oligoflexia bacterium]
MSSKPESFKYGLHILLCAAVALALISATSSSVHADARVDGFFRDDLVREGFFGDNQEIREDKNDVRRPESFFISREERRRNPNKAPSSSIKVERPQVIIRQGAYYPYPWWSRLPAIPFPGNQNQGSGVPPPGVPPQGVYPSAVYPSASGHPAGVQSGGSPNYPAP